MTKAQKWLDKSYRKNKRDSVEEINASSQDLTGSLKLEGFINLKKLDCSHNDLTTLDLTENRHLEEINCSNNKLNSFNLGDNSSLVRLDCSSNELSDIEFITTLPCPEKLLYLDLRNNCFRASKLNVFSPFSQLRELYLGTSDLVRINFLIYNQFYGSLKPLQDCQNLEVLCISNTEVNYGFEYLPDSLQEFFFADMRERLTGEDLGHSQILDELNLLDGNFTRWKNDKILNSERLPRLIKERDTFQKLTAFWKEKFEDSQAQQVNNLGKEFGVALKILQGEAGKQESNSKNHKEKEGKKMVNEIAELKSSLSIAEEKIKDLEIENENYKEANSLIREKYERLMDENPQLRDHPEKQEKHQAQVQIDAFKKK